MIDLKKYNLLVVDDDDDLRELMCSIFELQGFSVFVAASGDSAFKIVESNKIDLVISDMRMPFGDGMELLRNIRTRSRKTPVVIFVTGYSDISFEKCLSEGAYAVFTKPFNQKELIDSAKSALKITAN